MDMNKITKKFCAVLSLWFCFSGVEAQTIMDGKIAISNLSVFRAEDKLFVSMDIDVSAVEVKSNREQILTPSLVTEDNGFTLPSVMLAGRNRYYYHLRNGLVSDNTLYLCGTIKTVEYRSVVPYEEWMGRAALNMGVETRGCCSESVSEEGDLLTRLDLEQKTFVPRFVYIKPEVAPKISVIEGSAYIDFPVNRTELYEDYRRNPAELKKIRSTIDTIRGDSDTRILSVSIKGYASPEGSYAGNARLAQGRTETLRQYVQGLYAFPDTLLITAYEPEDWAGFERYVESSGLENRAGILEIIRSDLAPDDKDSRIKISYPKDYAFLLKEVYPGLRHSDYAVTYEIRAYTDEEEIKRLLKCAPQKLSLQEMYLATRQMEPGSDEYNETFEIAVRMFPDDEIANLNAANMAMGRSDMKRAERYLAKAGDTPETVYARGIYAALSGDYANAALFFTEAGQRGISEAEEALRQVEDMER